MGLKTRIAGQNAAPKTARASKPGILVALLALLLALPQMLFAQAPEKTSYDTSRIFTPAQLQTDFTILADAVAKTHPALYTYKSPEAWLALTTETRSQLCEGLTEEQFQVLVRKYLANVRCGHTVALPSEAWYAYQKADPKLLPVRVIIHQNRLYVKEAFEADSVLTPGTEITAIENIPAPEILEQMRAIHPRDGNSESFVRASVESGFQTYWLFLFGRQETYSIDYNNSLTSTGNIVVKAGKGRKEAPEQTANPAPFITEINNPNGRFYIPAENARIGILDINSFGNSDYRKFYKDAFKQMKAHKVEHLVIDVRNNGGGYFPHATFLLQYLLPEKFAFNLNRPAGKIRKDPYLKLDFISGLTNTVFNLLLPDTDKNDPKLNYAINYKPRKKDHYNGKIYVLTNGATFSISSYTASVLKHKANAVMVGEETGGGEVSANGILFFKLTLPETGTRVMLPYYQLQTVRGAAQTGRGVMPDIPVVYTKEEILAKKDKELEQVFQVIGQVSGF